MVRAVSMWPASIRAGWLRLPFMNPNTFGRPGLDFDYVPTDDMQLRYAMLEAVFGPARARQASPSSWCPTTP